MKDTRPENGRVLLNQGHGHPVQSNQRRIVENGIERRCEDPERSRRDHQAEREVQTKVRFRVETVGQKPPEFSSSQPHDGTRRM